MQKVITPAHARAITGGRMPHVPVEFELASKALQECINIDDAKIWSDKADALAFWAKTYHNDEYSRKAAQIKLLAFRKMGELAEVLRPKARRPDGGCAPGPQSLLQESGLSESQAWAARKMAKLPDPKFRTYVDATKPKSPHAIAMLQSDRSESLTKLQREGLYSFRSFARRYDATALARGITFEESSAVRDLIIEMAEWLDAFEHALPKRIK